MSRIHFHIDEVPWRPLGPDAISPRWKQILDEGHGGSKEFVFGVMEIPIGGSTPVHAHVQEETIYILSGRGNIVLGGIQVELGACSAAYFPKNSPHSIRSIDSEPFRFTTTYACEKSGQNLISLPPERIDCFKTPKNWNNAASRWAMREEIGEMLWIEASKGFRVRARRLFSQQYGYAKDLKLGVAEIDPGIHYTLHTHEQAEVYYVLSGKGIIYVAGEAIQALPGLALYLGPRVVHGADCTGENPLRLYYVYGAEQAGQEDTWTPVEEIYTEVRNR